METGFMQDAATDYDFIVDVGCDAPSYVEMGQHTTSNMKLRLLRAVFDNVGPPRCIGDRLTMQRMVHPVNIFMQQDNTHKRDGT